MIRHIAHQQKSLNTNNSWNLKSYIQISKKRKEKEYQIPKENQEFINTRFNYLIRKETDEVANLCKVLIIFNLKSIDLYIGTNNDFFLYVQNLCTKFGIKKG